MSAKTLGDELHDENAQAAWQREMEKRKRATMSALDECIAIADAIEGEEQFTGVALNARAELAQLRAQCAMLDDYAETIRMHEITIESQARQLAEAKKVIEEVDYGLQTWLEMYGDLGGSIVSMLDLVRQWLAANPAPEAEQ